ncbi:MAG: type II-A CRISPR-associated protein Csn2 [Lachnospiraceae bacterium]|nr:type II-A CRISPR-associated protein Csn2 [Lachnospiraceae bacterium]
MKLLYGDYNVQIEFHENEVQVLTIENPVTFRKALQELQEQYKGGEGIWILSEGESPIPLENYAEILWSPLLIDLNERKIVSKLYQEMRKVTEENFYQETEEIRTKIVQYLEKVRFELPYMIDYNMDIDVSGLYKLCDVKLECCGTDILQTLSDYIKVLSLLSNIKMLILVSIKDYFDKEQLLELYKMAFYYKVNLLLVEAVQRDRLEGEKNYILDQDNCLIEF